MVQGFVVTGTALSAGHANTAMVETEAISFSGMTTTEIPLTAKDTNGDSRWPPPGAIRGVFKTTYRRVDVKKHEPVGFAFVPSGSKASKVTMAQREFLHSLPLVHAKAMEIGLLITARALHNAVKASGWEVTGNTKKAAKYAPDLEGV